MNSVITIILLLIVIFLFILGFICSALENALSSANMAKLSEMSKKTPMAEKKYNTLLHMFKYYNGLISVILSLSNICAMVSVSLVTIIIKMDDGSAGLSAIFIAITTFGFIIIAEILPKNWARNKAEKWLFTFLWFIIFINFLFRPIVIILQKLNKSKNAKSVTEQQILEWVHIGAREGEIEKEEQALLESAIKFDDTSLDNIIIPWDEVSKIKTTDSVDNVIKKFSEERFSRYVVTSPSGRVVSGILLSKDLYIKWTGHKRTDRKISIRSLLREPLILRKNMKLPDAIKRMRIARQHIAIVKPNSGNEILGIVTLEDLVEQIFGKIYDEYDNYKVIEYSHRKFIILEDATMDEVFKVNLKLPKPPKTNYKYFKDWSTHYNHGKKLVNHDSFVYENVHFQCYIQKGKRTFRTKYLSKKQIIHKGK